MNTYSNRQSQDAKQIVQEKQSSQKLDLMSQEESLQGENKEQTHQSIQIVHDHISDQQIENQLESYEVIQQQHVDDQSYIQKMNKQESFGPKGNNDSGLFFITNPNFKTPSQQMSDEQYSKIQTNPEQYYDKQVEKLSSIKSEILKNQAQIQEGNSLFKRLQIQQESEISKDTKQIEISIEQFIKKLTANLQEQDQEMRYIQKQIDQQTIENQPIIRCLQSFENRVFRMEKEIGLVPETQFSPEDVKQQNLNKMVFQ
ncbi:hypothetical protein TTHERM_00470660 (macronuclear) [Tetrahymena thermophila SB210]|uniref:Uncharacterized protein n=1 Tax=Tetrahymena thermophila (strain SB210) TaxID=312017 RepID=I7MD11_TETTS|nr:hypothetical protein TTHERM_00470660 [Tetrahymena thermophila SB210]EAR85293.4 hypothetical protein TTHERM_00470660 [Tetrahymena thermophila SB210]|eukprot:XP_001032956.4 hypothetical protein TTHERM_00470660 [Tetrahymena thermophila SB210]